MNKIARPSLRRAIPRMIAMGCWQTWRSLFRRMNSYTHARIAESGRRSADRGSCAAAGARAGITAPRRYVAAEQTLALVRIYSPICAQCQKDDWKSQYHQGECQLLQDGNAYEVEARRKLHNNGWYFDYGPEGAHISTPAPANRSDCNPTGHQILRKDTGPHTYERAMYTSSVGYLAYGRRYPPHDVVPPRRPRPHPLPRDDGYPRGFLPTGYAWMDEAIKHMHVLKRGSSSRVLRELPKMYPVSQAVRAIDIPPFPPLPQTDGFVPTGDPFLDEQLLGEHLCKHGTAAQRGELETVVNARRESVEARKRLAVQREVRTAKAIEAAEKPKRYTRGTCV